MKTQVRKSDIKVDKRVQTFLNKRKTSEMEITKYNSTINGIEFNLNTITEENRNIIIEKLTIQKNLDIVNKQIKQLKVELNLKNIAIVDALNKNQNIENENRDLRQVINKVEGYKNSLKESEIKLENKENEIKILQKNIKNTDQTKNNFVLIWILLIILISLAEFIFYMQYYSPKIKREYISEVNSNFSTYLQSMINIGCEKENTGARTILVDDINNDGKLEGIVTAIFDGVDCKNSSETILYVYKLEDNFTMPPLKLTLSRRNRSFVSLRGIENGKLVFDKWNLRDYDQKKYNSTKIDKSHLRMYISVQNDSLNLKIDNY